MTTNDQDTPLAGASDYPAQLNTGKVWHGEEEMRTPGVITHVVACLSVALFSVASPARADVVLDLSIEEMTEVAHAVVHGTVTSVESAWDDSHTRIFTNVTISVSSYLSGSGPSTVSIRQAGGVVGSSELFIAGQPRFTVGEEVVVFLEPDGTGQPNRYVVVCMAAGKYTVSFDTITGERVVGQDLRGLNRVPARGRRAVRTRHTAMPFRFSELVDIVTRAALAGGAR